MGLKIEVIKERLQHIKKVLDELNLIRKTSKKEFLKVTQLQWSAERGLQIVCEAVFDIGNHILVGKFSLSPSDYQSIINLLAQNGVISDKLNRKFNKLVGFRNILVHDYLEVDAKEIYNHLETGLDDFYQFIKEIAAFLQKEIGS